VDLELATIENIVKELERRGMSVAIVVDRPVIIRAGSHSPPDIHHQEQMVYAGETSPGRQPLVVASFLAWGIQLALNKLTDTSGIRAENLPPDWKDWSANQVITTIVSIGRSLDRLQSRLAKVTPAWPPPAVAGPLDADP